MSIWLQWIVCQSWHAWVAGIPANLGDQQTHRGKQIQKPPVSPNPFTLVDHHNDSTRVLHPRHSNLAGHARDPFELFHSHPSEDPRIEMIVTCTTGACRIKRTRFVGSTNAQSCATSLLTVAKTVPACVERWLHGSPSCGMLASSTDESCFIASGVQTAARWPLSV
jgi:hypothetical protein